MPPRLAWEHRTTPPKRAATARSDKIATWYEEKRSGKTIARQELDRLRADARAGKIGRFYIYRLDRLARSGSRWWRNCGPMDARS